LFDILLLHPGGCEGKFIVINLVLHEGCTMRKVEISPVFPIDIDISN